MKILFVCSANVDRSPTAEKVIREAYPDIETKSAGIYCKHERRVNKELLEWADVILCMESWPHKQIIQRNYPELIVNKEIDCLNIPDKYEYMESWLVTRIKECFGEWLSKYQFDKKIIMEKTEINWKEKLELARKATQDVDAGVAKEYESPYSYAVPQSRFDEERKAWENLKGIPEQMLTKNDRERYNHFNKTPPKSSVSNKMMVMETTETYWKEKLEFARRATQDVDGGVSKEYDSSPGAYAVPQSWFDEERKAWKSLKGIPEQMLTERDKERYDHFNKIHSIPSITSHETPPHSDEQIKKIGKSKLLINNIKNVIRNIFSSNTKNNISSNTQRDISDKVVISESRRKEDLEIRLTGDWSCEYDRIRGEVHKKWGLLFDEPAPVTGVPPEWKEDLAAARSATDYVNYRVTREYLHPSDPCTSSEINAETAAWLKIKDIPSCYLTENETKKLNRLIDSENAKKK